MTVILSVAKNPKDVSLKLNMTRACAVSDLIQPLSNVAKGFNEIVKNYSEILAILLIFGATIMRRAPKTIVNAAISENTESSPRTSARVPIFEASHAATPVTAKYQPMICEVIRFGAMFVMNESETGESASSPIVLKK